MALCEQVETARGLVDDRLDAVAHSARIERLVFGFQSHGAIELGNGLGIGGAGCPQHGRIR